MISNLQLSTYPFQKRSWNTNEGRIIRRYDPTRISELRREKGMTQEQLAEAINISPTHMKHIESEHRKPSVDVLFSLADVLSFSMDAMLMETQSTDHAKRVNEINLLMNKCTDEELDIFLAALRELMKQKR